MSASTLPRTENETLREIFALAAGALSATVPADSEGRTDLYERRLREICAAAHRHLLDGKPLADHLRPLPAERAALDTCGLRSDLHAADRAAA